MRWLGWDEIRRDFDMIRVEERGILLIGHTGKHEMPSTCTCASTFISSRICEKDRLDPCESQANEESRISTQLRITAIWIPPPAGVVLAVIFRNLVHLLSNAEQSTGYSRGQTKRIISLNFERSYQRSKQSRYSYCDIIKSAYRRGWIRFTTLSPLFSPPHGHQSSQ